SKPVARGGRAVVVAFTLLALSGSVRTTLAEDAPVEEAAVEEAAPVEEAAVEETPVEESAVEEEGAVAETAAVEESAPTWTALAIYPPDVILESQRDRQQLVVMATRSDGVTVDVTGETELSLAAEGVAQL